VVSYGQLAPQSSRLFLALAIKQLPGGSQSQLSLTPGSVGGAAEV
jgi:hypothetical protein